MGRVIVFWVLFLLTFPVGADMQNGNPFDSDLQIFPYVPQIKVEGTKLSMPLVTLPRGKIYLQCQLFGSVLEWDRSDLPTDGQALKSMLMDDFGKFRTAQYWLLWKYTY